MKNRLKIQPSELLPPLPSPKVVDTKLVCHMVTRTCQAVCSQNSPFFLQELRPYPSIRSLKYLGHTVSHISFALRPQMNLLYFYSPLVIISPWTTPKGQSSFHRSRSDWVCSFTLCLFSFTPFYNARRVVLKSLFHMQAMVVVRIYGLLATQMGSFHRQMCPQVAIWCISQMCGMVRYFEETST